MKIIVTGCITYHYLVKVATSKGAELSFMSWITIFRSSRGYYCGNIRISWKYPRCVDIIRILWIYPRYVEIICIS